MTAKKIGTHCRVDEAGKVWDMYAPRHVPQNIWNDLLDKHTVDGVVFTMPEFDMVMSSINIEESENYKKSCDILKNDYNASLENLDKKYKEVFNSLCAIIVSTGGLDDRSVPVDSRLSTDNTGNAELIIKFKVK